MAPQLVNRFVNNFVNPNQPTLSQQQKQVNRQASGLAQAESAPQTHDWVGRTEEEITNLCENHERLIGIILEEEEDLISSHRQHIDDMVDVVKQVRDKGIINLTSIMLGTIIGDGSLT